MKTIIKKGYPCGAVSAPPSKSYAHRYLISAMLSGSECTVSNIYFSDDIIATCSCIEAMGCSVIKNQSSVTVCPSMLPVNHPVLDCRESGSTLRFLIPVALTKFDKVTFTGTKRLFNRGVGIYERIAEQNGISIEKTESSITFTGKLSAGHYEVEGNISSQYITGLLFALTALPGQSVIDVIPPVESKPYIDITLDVLSEFGIKPIQEGNRFTVGGQSYSACDCRVEGDYSNSAFLEAFNYLGGDIKLDGLEPASAQGDKVYREYFKKLNCGNCCLDIADAIDLGPVLFAFAALKGGATFTGTKRLKIKESDRATSMKQELEKMGCKITVLEDSVIVGTINAEGHSYVVFDGHNDHRIVMACSLFMTICDIEIEGCQAVRKSFPNYFEVLGGMGVNIEYVH